MITAVNNVVFDCMVACAKDISQRLPKIITNILLNYYLKNTLDTKMNTRFYL